MKKTFILLLILFLFSGCTKPEEAILEGNSINWKVSIDYQLEGNKLVEIPTIVYLGNEIIDNALVSINYSPGPSKTTNTIRGTEYFKNKKIINLPTRSKVKNWKETKYVQITWTSDNGKKYEETINLYKIN